MPVDGIRSSSGNSNTTADINSFVITGQMFQQLLNRSASRRNNNQSGSGCFSAGISSDSTTSPTRYPSVDDGRTPPQSLFVRLYATIGLASSFAFDPDDALFFHVPTWSTFYGGTGIGFDTVTNRQQTVLKKIAHSFLVRSLSVALVYSL